MQYAMTATLLSAFVFPGSGHFMLKRHGTAWALIVTTCVPLCFVVYHLVQATQHILNRIEKTNMPADFTIMLGALLDRPFGNQTELVSYASYLILACWLFGVVDAYRLGSKMDAERK